MAGMKLRPAIVICLFFVGFTLSLAACSTPSDEPDGPTPVPYIPSEVALAFANEVQQSEIETSINDKTVLVQPLESEFFKYLKGKP